jgi:predicted DNA-binding transcriptional regulator AlpA
MPDPRHALVSLNEVAAEVGVTRKTIMEWVRAGRFPAPLSVALRRRYWTRAALDALYEAARPAGFRKWDIVARPGGPGRRRK